MSKSEGVTPRRRQRRQKKTRVAPGRACRLASSAARAYQWRETQQRISTRARASENIEHSDRDPAEMSYGEAPANENVSPNMMSRSAGAA